jgi:hypothetical protein
MNDLTLPIAAGGMAAWIIIGIAGKVYDKWFREKAVAKRVKKQIATGKIPEDYSVIEREVRDLNNAQERSVDLHGVDERRHRLGELQRLRERVGRVREAGWTVGNNAAHRNQPIKSALRANPFNKRTDPGAYKQWVKGVCMGMSKRDKIYRPEDYI